MLSYTEGLQVFFNDMQLYGYKFKSHAEFFSFLMRFFNEFSADLYMFSTKFSILVYVIGFYDTDERNRISCHRITFLCFFFCFKI